MSKTIESRLEKLEAKHAGTSRIFVLRDGEYTEGGAPITRAEVEAVTDKIVLAVVYETTPSIDAGSLVDLPDEVLAAAIGVDLKTVTDDDLRSIIDRAGQAG
jgi:hypothetical protein